ncbi:MAG: dihydropteroate synthase [Syntrophothermus sp.]|uniref:dihydropteroate synthase n=1 Tax=Syntrophothermus sp. TaxID=2736299 RepID=UPI00257E9694|nr:dihydropteroate synthase [Syntrophothermus sp.]NSW82962.1 dihydropteroate synthase [Syntrophothermus sp.]
MKGDHVVFIQDQREAEQFLREVGADEAGVRWMKTKAVFRAVKLKDIPCPAANIIKQEMLSKGGEAAVKRGTVSGQGTTDVLLLGTVKQYQRLIKKLRMQPFGLKKIADELSEMLKNIEGTGPTVMQLPRGQELVLGQRTLVMGILNVTPDSFSDGGHYYSFEAAVERALAIEEEGADILDIGGMSTRPGHAPIPPEEELARVLPVVEALAGRINIPISVDTYRATVARACLEAGAGIINDVGGLLFDSEMAEVVAEFEAPVVVMHNRMPNRPPEGYRNLIDEMIEDLQVSLKRAEQAGIPKANIIIDPGVGFGKIGEENFVILKRLREFKSLGYPLLLGVSRKSFIGTALNLPVEERLEGSLAAAVIGILNGADIVRVHDVKETKRVATIADAVK